MQRVVLRRPLLLEPLSIHVRSMTGIAESVLRIVTSVGFRVPDQSGWTVHHEALSPLITLDELAFILMWPVEVAVIDVLLCAGILVVTVVAVPFRRYFWRTQRVIRLKKDVY